MFFARDRLNCTPFSQPLPDITTNGQNRRLEILPVPPVQPTLLPQEELILVKKLKSTINTSCPPIPSASKKVRIAAIPFVDFQSPNTACVGLPVTFTDQSILDSDTVGLRTKYLWNFGDAATSSVQNPTHTYATAQTFNVSLTVSYINNSCPASKVKAVASSGNSASTCHIESIKSVVQCMPIG